MARQHTLTTKASRRSPTPGGNSTSKEEGTHDDSQGSDDQDTIKLAKAMMESSKKRREAKRKAIELEHGKRVIKTRANITKLMDNEKQKSAPLGAQDLFTAANSKEGLLNAARLTKLSINVRKAQLERLASLMKKRSMLETTIIANIRAMETAYFDCSDEITVICKGRLEDLR
ncbi:MAG: hypothetical protein M1835_000097 [Candelina submexicana]|nr:MAG: hypothetical protein M1835_000097 [Candelina submexicana]